MIRPLMCAITAASIAFPALGCGGDAKPSAENAPAKVVKTPEAKPADLDKQAKAAVDRGAKFLFTKQGPDGAWEKNPGITGIVCLALLKSGRGYNDVADPFVRRPVEYLLKLQKSDGGIYEQELANYTTSIAVQVLIATKNPKHKDAIAKARAFLLQSQLDGAEGYESGDPGYGGQGYGSSLRPDLSNTQMWADAMKDLEKSGLERDSEAWKKTVIFVARCQNKSETNDSKVSGVTWSDDGGATYSPFESKAYEVTLPDGRKGLRSYGSMTYAFLKTMIYADVKKDDERVQAAYKWIQKHYTVDENPEMGLQGLFYYYHTMAKALKAIGQPAIVDDKGVSHDWRADLMRKILAMQAPDGSWVNTSDRWFESNPALVTAYAVLTLEELLQ